MVGDGFEWRRAGAETNSIPAGRQARGNAERGPGNAKRETGNGERGTGNGTGNAERKVRTAHEVMEGVKAKAQVAAELSYADAHPGTRWIMPAKWYA